MFGLWATGRTFECITAKSHLHINKIKSNNNVEEHSLVELHHYIDIEIERNFVSHQNRIIGRWPNYVRKQQFLNHFYLLVVEVEASKNYHGIRAIIVQLHKFVQKNA